MKWNAQNLGTIAMVTAPMMLIELILNRLGGLGGGEFGPVDGVLGLIYLTGFSAAIVGLRRAKAMGNRFGATFLLVLQIALLLLAAVQQIMEIAFRSQMNSSLFGIADLAWPVSHVTMIVTGITVLTRKSWRGAAAWAPLLFGLAVPLLLIIGAAAGKDAGRWTFGVITTATLCTMGARLRQSGEGAAGTTHLEYNV